MTFRTSTRRWAASGAAAALGLTLAAGMQTAASAAPPGPASPAGGDPYSPAYQHAYRHGAVPTRGAAARMREWMASHNALSTRNSINNLAYGGGIDGIGVSTGHQKVYLVFYGSQWGSRSTDSHGDLTLSGDPSGEAPYLQRLFKGLGGGGELWSGVLTQYCQGVATGSQTCPAAARHVAYPRGGALAGVWADESAASPKQATAVQLAREAVKAAAHFGNGTAAANRNAQYVILSPTGTHPDQFPSAGFCAWHDSTVDYATSSPAGDLAFTNMPYVTDAGASCGQRFVNSGSAGALDGVSIVEGHEYAETATDQNPGGGWWVMNSKSSVAGEENADVCAWLAPGSTGGAGDLTLPTGSFAMQGTWANDANGGKGGCEFTHKIVSTQLLRNPGFESGALSAWTGASGVVQHGTSSLPAHSGAYLARLNGGSTGTQTLAQKLTIPATYSSASLSFWLAVVSNHATSDTLKVRILNSSGHVLATLHTYGNASSGYARRSFSLNAYLGKTISVKFIATVASHNTAFGVDDTAVNAS